LSFRVAILSYRWNLRIKQHIKEAYGNHPAVKQDPQNTFFQICAFGLPAIQTVVTLITRQVDADELLGTCYVGIGNQSDKALLLLVAIPSLLYWMISCGYLLTGYLRKKSLKNVKIPAHVSGLGTFL
jgi:frizzled 4